MLPPLCMNCCGLSEHLSSLPTVFHLSCLWIEWYQSHPRRRCPELDRLSLPAIAVFGWLLSCFFRRQGCFGSGGGQASWVGALLRNASLPFSAFSLNEVNSRILTFQMAKRRRKEAWDERKIKSPSKKPTTFQNQRKKTPALICYSRFKGNVPTDEGQSTLGALSLDHDGLKVALRLTKLPSFLLFSTFPSSLSPSSPPFPPFFKYTFLFVEQKVH